MKQILIVLAALLVSCTRTGPGAADHIENIVAGEIDHRIKIVSDRILFGHTPQMTPDFILADLSLKPEFKRRFTAFSGDISGRYFDVFSSYPIENNPIDLQVLMNKALQYQHPDGRFGNPDLTFDPEKLASPHMALLWGNGRLLVGLMKYYESDPQPKVLAAAKKLGDFINTIASSGANQEVADRLKGNSYMGYICFTQLMEGLVLLSDETGDKNYLNTAEQVYPFLPAPGRQHCHGYLNTLLGTLMLYDRTGKPEQLRFVKDRYDELIHSPEYLITGGVPEYFGEIEIAEGVRDEGCSEADFVMLSLGLWKTTGENSYLEKAEHCLLNHLFVNQYQTGDFGHRTLDPKMGFLMDQDCARSWWCCNFHALRALHETKEIVFTQQGDTIQYNLFLDGEYIDHDIHLVAEPSDSLSNQYSIRVLKAGKKSQLAIRKPRWAKNMAITVDGKPYRTKQLTDYLIIDEGWKAGDQIDIHLDYNLKWVDKDKNELAFPISGKTQAALFYGPYLMSVDGNFQPFFDSEPNYSNYLILQDSLKSAPAQAPPFSKLKDTYLAMQHVHSDMFGIYPVVLRPICETTWQPPCNVRVWFTVSQ